MKLGKSPKNTVSVTLLLLMLLVAAFIIRLMPLCFSPLPFNNDSLTECEESSFLIRTGSYAAWEDSLYSDSHSMITPALNLILAFTCVTLGMSPLQIAQILTAIFSMLTVGSLFLLGRLVVGTNIGGLAPAFAALLMGTFVFTSGSAWKEALGISLLVFLFWVYPRRNELRYRTLVFVILVVIASVHHLVAAVAFLGMAFLLVWSWIFAISFTSIQRRHVADAVTIIVPIVIGMGYYWYSSLTRLDAVSSPISVAMFLSLFVLIALCGYLVMSLRKHTKWSFAPLVGVAFIVVLTLDYFGYIFDYTPSVSRLYAILIVASGYIIALGWFGTEMIVERRPVYRGVHMSLLVSPLLVILFAAVSQDADSAHQVAYRAFDFFDLFIFLGMGSALSFYSIKNARRYLVLGAVTVACVLATFPFGYYTADLVGVRHDTQYYELDSVDWIVGHSESTQIVSDERIGYISQAMGHVEKRAYLPADLLNNVPLQPGYFYIMEDSWMRGGVNNYPDGTAVIPTDVFSYTLEDNNVVYVGGDLNDLLRVFWPRHSS